MKSFFYTLLATASLLLAVSSISKVKAQEVSEKNDSSFYSHFYVMQTKPMQFKMTYHYPNMDRVRVRIFDGKGDILFNEKALVYKKYEKLFDLSFFNDGQYTFELMDGEQAFKQSFNVITKTTRIVTAENHKSIIVAGF
jgi:hypothetical protein